MHSLQFNETSSPINAHYMSLEPRGTRSRDVEKTKQRSFHNSIGYGGKTCEVCDCRRTKDLS